MSNRQIDAWTDDRTVNAPMKKTKDLLKQCPLECQRGVKIISKATTQHSDERVTQIHHDWTVFSPEVYISKRNSCGLKDASHVLLAHFCLITGFLYRLHYCALSVRSGGKKAACQLHSLMEL